MKEKQVTLYICDYCGKKYQRKHYAEIHEKRCNKNPDNYRPCFDCENLKKRETEVSFCSYSGEVNAVYKLFYCSKREVFIYPPSAGFKKNSIDIGDLDNIAMPTKCEYLSEFLKEM